MKDQDRKIFSKSFDHDFFEAQLNHKNTSIMFFLLFFAAVILSGILLGSVNHLMTDPNDRYPAWITIFSNAFWMALLVAVVAMTIGRKPNGKKIARRSGATLVEEISEKEDENRINKLLEELTLASAMPRPELFLIEDPSINSRAVGTKTKDFWGSEIRNFAIILTTGAIEKLNDLELQALLAHEMAHIQNGDVNLNMHLMAYSRSIMYLPLYVLPVLYGVLKIHHYNEELYEGFLGLEKIFTLSVRYLGPVLIATIFALLLARLIQKRFLRNRELLADACAVQFTRSFEGIKGLLEKVAQSNAPCKASSMTNAHMFFYHKARFSILSTHPSIRNRLANINKLEENAVSRDLEI